MGEKGFALTSGLFLCSRAINYETASAGDYGSCQTRHLPKMGLSEVAEMALSGFFAPSCCVQ